MQCKVVWSKTGGWTWWLEAGGDARRLSQRTVALYSAGVWGMPLAVLQLVTVGCHWHLSPAATV